METGSRFTYREVFTATAVDIDLNPGDHFQLIDVTFKFNTLPTTSEDITIVRSNASSDAMLEASDDPSLWTDTSKPIRFDKRFTNGDNIDIDYTNTDGRTITVLVQYQLDQSIGN